MIKDDKQQFLKVTGELMLTIRDDQVNGYLM